VQALVEDMGFINEFNATAGHPDEAVAFLRRLEATPGQFSDGRLLHADAVIHVASPSAERVRRFCRAAAQLLVRIADVHVIGGVVRPTRFTGGAMHDFAYASQRQQVGGADMPHAFLLPMSKTAGWWAKSWMERHTYFLPRYDDNGRMINQGHALAASAGIPRLLRRTYRHEREPAPEGHYDFINYFECADGDVTVFHDVCAALRDVARNPEWRFVREGPTWHGRRGQTWAELFAQA
jgi:hypothetical protein